MEYFQHVLYSTVVKLLLRDAVKSGRKMAVYVFEYAWRHRHLQVVREVLNKFCEKLASAEASHYSLASFSLHKIVVDGMASHIPIAITLVEQLFDELGDSHSEKLCRAYANIVRGLKVKMVLDCLGEPPKVIVKTLALHFPRGRSFINLKAAKQWPDIVKEVDNFKKTFRKQILTLAHQQKRREFVTHDQCGKSETAELVQYVSDFLEALEDAFPLTFLDKLMQEQATDTQSGSQWLSSPDVSVEILKDFVYGRSSLQPADLMDLVHTLNAAEAMSGEQACVRCLIHSCLNRNQSNSFGTQCSQICKHFQLDATVQSSLEETMETFVDGGVASDTDIDGLDEDTDSSGMSDKTPLIPDIKIFHKPFDLPVCIVKVFHAQELDFTDLVNGKKHKVFN